MKQYKKILITLTFSLLVGSTCDMLRYIIKITEGKSTFYYISLIISILVVIGVHWSVNQLLDHLFPKAIEPLEEETNKQLVVKALIGTIKITKDKHYLVLGHRTNKYILHNDDGDLVEIGSSLFEEDKTTKQIVAKCIEPCLDITVGKKYLVLSVNPPGYFGSSRGYTIFNDNGDEDHFDSIFFEEV